MEPGEEPRARVRGIDVDKPLAVLRAKLYTPDGRAWLGVTLDVFLTVFLATIAWEPVLTAVRTHAVPAAWGLAALHVMLVPVVFFLGLDDPAVTSNDEKAPWRDKIIGFAFYGFFLMGWLAPVCAYTIGRVPGFVMGATIFAHLAPVVILFVLVILEMIFGESVGRGLEKFLTLAGRLFTVTTLTVLFAAYLATLEAFLLLVKTRPGDLGRIALPAWFISYLPTRLFFARITGLCGPERWTFAIANLHLLVRLLLTRQG